MYYLKKTATNEIMATRDTKPFKGAEIPEGCEAGEKKGVATNDKLSGETVTKAPTVTLVESDQLKALKALDASQETGALKTVIEYLQSIV